ncbi:MAG: hypothetical protein J2P25_05550 [Nocardiopsaceae bacterium]|nr:hypothetical protein [Nocardiopsaceae bacterium]
MRRVASRARDHARLRDRLAFERGERLLSAARSPEGHYALVTSDRALYYRAGNGAWPRLGWEQVTGVSWDAAGRRMVIAGLGGSAHTRAEVCLRDRGSMPEIAMERITHTTLGSWRIPIQLPASTAADGHPGFGGRPGADRSRHLRVEARRKPVTGEVLWFVSADGGPDGGHGLAAGQLHGYAERAVARLSADFGLPCQAPVPLPWPPRR